MNGWILVRCEGLGHGIKEVPWLLPGWLVGLPEMRSGEALLCKSRGPGMKGGGGGSQVLMSSRSQSP